MFLEPATSKEAILLSIILPDFMKAMQNHLGDWLLQNLREHVTVNTRILHTRSPKLMQLTEDISNPIMLYYLFPYV